MSSLHLRRAKPKFAEGARGERDLHVAHKFEDVARDEVDGELGGEEDGEHEVNGDQSIGSVRAVGGIQLRLCDVCAEVGQDHGGDAHLEGSRCVDAAELALKLSGGRRLRLFRPMKSDHLAQL